jgi:hypothetical protein
MVSIDDHDDLPSSIVVSYVEHPDRRIWGPAIALGRPLFELAERPVRRVVHSDRRCVHLASCGDHRRGVSDMTVIEYERFVVAEFDPAQTWGVAVTWSEFQQSRPDLAEAGHALLYQFGVGLAFLATVGRDGGPRVHPMCPLIHQGGLYGFIVPGPEQADLHRGGRYSLHSFPCEDNEDAFFCTGRAQAVDDPAIRKALAELFVTERSALKVPEPAPTTICSASASSAVCSPGQPVTATRARSTPSGATPAGSGHARPAARQ